MKRAALVIALALAACNLNTPPHATSWLPTCLLFCFSRVEVTDQSTSTQSRYAKPPKPASAAKPASVASSASSSSTIASAHHPASAHPASAPTVASATTAITIRPPLPASGPAEVSRP